MKWSEYTGVKQGTNLLLNVRYPKYDIFARDRAYMELLAIQARCTLIGYEIQIGNVNKKINTEYEFSKTGDVLQIDITDVLTAAYSIGTKEISIVIAARSNNNILAFANISSTITYTADGYSPLLDFAPCIAISNPNVLLTPPTRMLYTDTIMPSVLFLLDNTFQHTIATYGWSFCYADITFPDGMVLEDLSELMDDKSSYVLQIMRTIRNITMPVYTLHRSLQLVDACREYVLVAWRTPWGAEVQHLFYLHSYNGSKTNTKQTDSPLGGYTSVSDMVRSGSFYIDAITEEYDLWYYKSMMRADSVLLQTQTQKDIMSLMPMPAFNSYYNVRITGCSVGDIIADGVNSKVLQFEFERED